MARIYIKPYRLLTLLVFVIHIVDVSNGMSGQCPNVCSCRWKSGKQTVECVDKALIKIPKSIDSATQVLDLSRNNLQTLPREAFKKAGLNNLQRVFLRSCRIGQIDDMAFRGLSNLIELDLSFNLLTTIPATSFQDIPLLRDLVLSNNPIQKIDGYAFQTVPNLVKLDLSNCELQTIAARAFHGLNSLETLKLNGNRLNEIRIDSVQNLNKLHAIELHENAWYCDCRMRDIKKWLTINNIPSLVAPTCSGGPEHLIHRSFMDLDLDDFACKPEILPANRYIDARAGENATIVCRVSAVPSAYINWLWNGRLLINNTAFSTHQRVYIYEEGEFEKRSILVLTNSQETDSSDFYCDAKNRAGNAEANYTLRVSMRAAGIVTLGSGQIAGLSIAFGVLIFCILIVIVLLLLRIRRMPYSESKTPRQIEVVTVVNGGQIPNGKVVTPTNPSPIDQNTNEHKLPEDLNFCNPVQKPPRVVTDPVYPTAYFNGSGSIINPNPCYISPGSGSGNNPDLINDTNKPLSDLGTTPDSAELLERPLSGEYSRNADPLYPAGFWQSGDLTETYNTRTNTSSINPSFQFDEKAPIIRSEAALSADDASAFCSQRTGYPTDYGLPIVTPDNGSSSASCSNSSNNQTKTLRVWQKGAVPVLPPVTALKRVLTNNRNSPDEGYQEGCGTDV